MAKAKSSLSLAKKKSLKQGSAVSPVPAQYTAKAEMQADAVLHEPANNAESNEVTASDWQGTGDKLKAEGSSLGDKLGRLLNHRYRPYIFIFVYTFLLYAQTLKYDVVGFDDDVLVKQNSSKIAEMSNIITSFKTDVFFQKQGTFYRPIFNVSLILDTQFLNKYFNIYHFVNILMHAIICSLLYLLLLRFRLDKIISLIITVIFISHPISAFSVSWIGARNDLLIALFFIPSLISLIDYYKSNQTKHLVMHSIYFVLSLYSKETSLIFPLIFLSMIFILQKKIFVSSKEIKLLFIWIISILLFLFMRSNIVANIHTQEHSLNNVFFNLQVFPEMIRNIFIPIDLSNFPVYDTTRVLIGIVIISIFIFYLANRYKYFKSNGQITEFYLIIWGFLFFILLLLPGTIRKVSGNLYMDYLQHRAYLPMLGVLFSLSYIIIKSNLNIKILNIFYSIFIVLVIALTVLSININNVYYNKLSFWDYATNTRKHSEFIWFNSADFNKEAGKIENAIYSLNKAIEINPKYWKALYNKAMILDIYFSNYHESLIYYKRALNNTPDVNKANIWFNMGIIYSKIKQFDEAINSYLKAVYYSNGNNKASAWYNLGTVYSKLKDFRKEVECYDSAIVYRPDHFGTWNNKGLALKDLGRTAEAEACFRKAKELKAKQQ